MARLHANGVPGVDRSMAGQLRMPGLHSQPPLAAFDGRDAESEAGVAQRGAELRPSAVLVHSRREAAPVVEEEAHRLRRVALHVHGLPVGKAVNGNGDLQGVVVINHDLREGRGAGGVAGMRVGVFSVCLPACCMRCRRASSMQLQDSDVGGEVVTGRAPAKDACPQQALALAEDCHTDAAAMLLH
eukprot:366260-Chlamydomonas_euryale.AAC.49